MSDTYSPKPERIQLTYSGNGLQLDKVTFAVAHITSIQKPRSDEHGCIVGLDSGEKFPVVEKYDNIISMLRSWETIV